MPNKNITDIITSELRLANVFRMIEILLNIDNIMRDDFHVLRSTYDAFPHLSYTLINEI